MLNNQIALGVDCFIVYPGIDDREVLDSFTEARRVNGSGVINPGYAIDQIRLCTEFSGEKQVLLQQLMTLSKAAEEVDWGVISFAAKRATDMARVLRQSVWNGPVYKAVTKQLFAPEEGGDLAGEIAGLADTGSCVIDFDVTHLPVEERLLRFNLLNALAPVAMFCAHRQFRVERIGRHKSWRYCADKERLPLGWQWQNDWLAYQRQVKALTATFAGQEERASYRDALGSGLFYWAQLLSVGGREVLRFWSLPTMAPLPILTCLQAVDEWLEVAVQALQGLKPASLAEAVSFLPPYQGQRIPHEQSARLYLWESQ